jgi:hypothetical protein
VPLDALREEGFPRETKISRLAVVPQTNRRGRLILNLSANVEPQGKAVRRQKPALQLSVNATTAPAECQEAVKDLGNALPGLLAYMYDTNPEWTIHWSKVDLSDGFWRMIVDQDRVPNFMYQMPKRTTNDPEQLVLPSALQMGWKNSPAYFCHATRIVTTLATRLMKASWIDQAVPPHHLEQNLAPTPSGHTPNREATGILTVFVDDFMMGTSLPPCTSPHSTQTWAARCLLHAVHAIFPPPAITNHTNGRDSISAKKLAAGDGQFAPEKTLLGFDFIGKPGAERSVSLPADKCQTYCEAINHALALPRNYISLAAFQKLHGRLQHAAACFPLIRGFMTPLNAALANKGGTIGLAKGSALRQSLQLMPTILHIAHQWPSHITELVPPPLPHVYQFMDAAAVGAGGVCLPCTITCPAIVWRVAFPADICTAVRLGTISNSDVESFAWFVANFALDEWLPSTAGVCCYYGSDNSPTVGWATKQASKATSPAPQQFIYATAIVNKWNRRAPADTEHWAGSSNLMADFASRSFDMGFPADQDDSFRAAFTHKFPLPTQLGSWKLAQPRTDIISLGFSILRREGLALPKSPPSGSDGLLLPPELAKILGCEGFKAPISTWNGATSSWPLLNPSGTVCPQMYDRLLARRSRRRFAKSASAWNNEALETPGEPAANNRTLTGP